MKREPFILYIFRFLIGMGLLAFMILLYWSSNLLEKDVKAIREEIATMKEEMTRVQLEVPQTKSRESDKPQEIVLSESPYANILVEDPFYIKTLPGLLKDNFKYKGSYRTATYAKPQNLHPFSGYYDVSSLTDLCSLTVATTQFGKYETFAPSAADRMEERVNQDTGLPEFWIFLRKDLFWEPIQKHFLPRKFELAQHFMKRHPLTAYDFKFWWDALMNPNVTEMGAITLRNYFSEIDSFEVVDNYTFVVRWKGKDIIQEDGSTKKMLKYNAKLLTGGIKPFASFLYKYFADGTKIIEDDSDPDIYRKSSVWAQNFSQHWAKNVIPSCGPWKFDGMNDERTVLLRNRRYFFPLAALMDVYELSYKSSPDTIWQEFKAGTLTTYSLQPEKAAEWQTFKNSPAYAEQVKKNNAIKELEYLFRSYTYIGWNESKPFFNSKKVRQALTMAIDRRRIVEQNLNGLAVEIHGTFFVNSPSNNPNLKPLPFDPQEAKKLLEEEGWYDSDGDGILDKEIDGKRVPFSFAITYYVKNPVTKSVVEYVSTALKEIGIDCQLNGVDIADLTSKIDDKSFDAYYLAWTLGTPPDDPRQLWHSSGARIKGSSNTVGFMNKEADKIIDALDYEYNPEKRIALYHKFDAIIHEEQPYTFLYTPKIMLLYRESLQNVFLPSERQDLIPGANVAEPQFSIYWINHQK